MREGQVHINAGPSSKTPCEVNISLPPAAVPYCTGVPMAAVLPCTGVPMATLGYTYRGRSEGYLAALMCCAEGGGVLWAAGGGA